MKWLVDGELLDKFKSCAARSRFESPIFDGWLIACIPDESKFRFGIRWMSWPKNVSKIYAKMFVNLSYGTSYIGVTHLYKIKMERESLRTGRSSFPFNRHSLQRSQLEHVDTLHFQICVEIMRLFDVEGNEIPRKEWTNHGLIDVELLDN